MISLKEKRMVSFNFNTFSSVSKTYYKTFHVQNTNLESKPQRIIRKFEMKMSVLFRTIQM